MIYMLIGFMVVASLVGCRLVLMCRRARNEVADIRRATLSARTDLMGSVALLKQILLEVRAAALDHGPLSELFALDDEAVREWALTQASRAEIESLTAHLERATDQILQMRKALYEGTWIEMDDVA